MKTICMASLLSILPVAGIAQIPESDSVRFMASTVIAPVVNEKSFDVESLYGILALTVPFIMIIAIVFISMRYMTREKLARYKVMETALDKGIDLPPAFFEDKNKAIPGNKMLYTAIKNILIGLVLFAALTVFFELKFGIWLLIITANGIAQLVSYLVEEKKKKDEVAFSAQAVQTNNRETVKNEEVVEVLEAEEVNAHDQHIDGEIK